MPEESDQSAQPNVGRPQIKPRTFSNDHVPMAPSVLKRMGINTDEPRILSPELFPYIASLLNIDFSVLVENHLQIIAESGRSEPVQFLTIIDMEVAQEIEKFKSLDYGTQPKETFESAKRIAALHLAHATVLMCWHQRLEQGTEGEQWKVAL